MGKKYLFLILGPAASGKSEFLRYVTNLFPDRTAIIPKLTTRDQLHTDANRTSSELVFLSEQSFDEINPEYQYAYGADRYGVVRETIQSCLAAKDIGLLVVGRAKLIRRIKQDFADVDVIPVYIQCDYAKRKEHLEAAGHDRDTVARKLRRDHDTAVEYHSHQELYHELLLNDGTLDVYHGRIEELVCKHMEPLNRSRMTAVLL